MGPGWWGRSQEKTNRDERKIDIYLDICLSLDSGLRSRGASPLQAARDDELAGLGKIELTMFNVRIFIIPLKLQAISERD